jgi:hypothetical protein
VPGETGSAAACLGSRYFDGSAMNLVRQPGEQK